MALAGAGALRSDEPARSRPRRNAEGGAPRRPGDTPPTKRPWSSCCYSRCNMALLVSQRPKSTRPIDSW